MAFRAASAGLLPTAPCSSGRPVKSVAPPPPFGAAPRSRLHGRALFRFQGKLRLEARSIPVSGPQGSSEGCGGDSGGSDGQVTAALIDSMRAKISEALETTDVNIVDVYGDGR